MNSFAEYIREIRKSLEKGDSTEHTHRTAIYHEPALTVGTARELAQRMAGIRKEQMLTPTSP